MRRHNTFALMLLLLGTIAQAQQQRPKLQVPT